ncbi:hypothetical protein HZA85_02295 [Candidatus Uhrbacteria bacterium]|nr:hypothetical protein [Candidatus Uhrbacteria bacterium]
MNFFVRIGAVGVLLSLFFAPRVLLAAGAADTCACFCANEKLGAQKLKDEAVTPDQCETGCTETGRKVAVCAKKPKNFPGNNPLCFDSAACGKQEGVLDKTQAPECPNGWSYCYPNIEKSAAKLNIPIAGLETVGDLGVYVSAIYKWMVGISGFLAITMVMIGGIQYVLASGSENVTKAKERMQNGVIGMALLFGVVLILQTINPQLLKLEIPRPSLIRRVDFVKNSCEKLAEQGYTLELTKDGKKECGNTAEIKKGPGGTTVAEGLTCQYTKCEKGACISTSTDGEGVCVDCRNVSKNNPTSPGIPSKSVCKGMEIQKTNAKGELLSANYCEFQPGGVLNIYNPKQTTTAVALSADSCFETVVDCSTIKECENYDNAPVYYWDGGVLKKQDLDSILPITFQQICINDPCEAGKKEGSKCTWSITDCD